MPERLKLSTKLDVVEDLSVEDQYQLPVLADHRLIRSV